MSKESVLDFDVCTYDKEELIENIFKDYQGKKQLFIVSINPEILVTNYKNDELKKSFNKQKYQIPDGTGIVWASKRKKGKIKARITGIDLMLALCEEAQKHNSKIYLYGGKDEIAEKAAQKLSQKYPKLNIVGTSHGYCNEEDVVQDIKVKEADILFVGIGSPKQEKFIIENKDKLKNVKILMPVGGSFDVISQTKKRAPKWMIKCNIEWLYRLFQEPKRIVRQTKLIKFIYLVLRNKKGEKNG